MLLWNAVRDAFKKKNNKRKQGETSGKKKSFGRLKEVRSRTSQTQAEGLVAILRLL